MAQPGAQYFQTPSGNIGCFLLWYDNVRSVECMLGQQAFADPPRPKSCDFDWVPQFILGAQASYGACRSDVSGVPTNTVLGYGGIAINGPVKCKSLPSGLSCANRLTAHGFAISRATYQLF